jgi:hypothetical protein
MRARTSFTIAAIGAGIGVLTMAGTGGAAGTSATSKTYQLKANLDTRQQAPAPKGATGASGLLTAKVASASKRGSFTWKLSFRNLTGKAIHAEVNLGGLGKTGPMIIPLCRPCRAGAYGVYYGPIGANTPLLKALLHGGTYVVVATNRNPKGEIRGQIRVTTA